MILNWRRFIFVSALIVLALLFLAQINQTTTPLAAAPAGLAEIVINEMDYDQPGTDGAEFIELHNNSTFGNDLDGFHLALINGNAGGATIYLTITLPAVNLPGGGYFVVCGDAAVVTNCDYDVTPDTNLIQNGAPDAVALVFTFDGTIMDTVSYEGDTGAPYTEGSGAGLLDDPVFTNLGISRFPNGVDTQVNNVDLSQRCITPGLVNTSVNTNCGGTPTPTSTATATSTPTNTPTSTPTNTPTNTSTSTPTNTPTSTPTNIPTDTPTAVATATPSPTGTTLPTETPTHTATATIAPSSTPTPPPTDVQLTTMQGQAGNGGWMAVVVLLLAVLILWQKRHAV